MNSVVPTRALGVLAVALTAAAGQAQVFSSTPSIPITDNTIQDAISVAGGPASITDVNVLIDITHTWAGDLDIILVPPSGDVYIHLTSDNGGSGDNYRVTRFDMDAGQSITTGTAPFNGSFVPEGGDIAWTGDIPLPGPSLSDLNSLLGLDSNGTWTLIVDDDAAGDSGTLHYWSLEFNGAVDTYTPPTPPSGTGTVDPTVAATGDQVTFTVTTQIGVPASDIDSVTIDLSALGGSSAEPLFDDGTNGDATAGDGVYSLNFNIPGSAMRGTASLGYTITDELGRSATGSVALTVEIAPGPDQYSEVYPSMNDAGDSIETASAIAGDGPLNAILGFLDPADTDIFAINICEPGNFSATTFPAVSGGVTDTQLFLFDANGVGVAHNDDIPDGQEGDATALSRLSSDLVNTLPAGIYYLAITNYNRDPVDSGGALLWTNTPFNTERAPDGPGAGNPLAGWTGSPASSGAYTISLTGTCFDDGGGSGCPGCAADYDQNGGVDGADIAAFFADFEQGAACADVDQNGGVDGADIGAFFQVFEAGGC